MERVWEDDSPHAEFIRTLMNNRVTELLSSQEWLKILRYRHDEVKWWLKRAGHIFKERNVNLYQRIAQAHGECWDMEDEQKSAHAISQNVAPPNVKEKPRQNAVSLDHPRQVGVREGEEEERELHVRASDEGREKHLQTSGRQNLYRRAGGT